MSVLLSGGIRLTQPPPPIPSLPPVPIHSCHHAHLFIADMIRIVPPSLTRQAVTLCMLPTGSIGDG